MKKITLHWINFLIIFVVIFFLGVLIGFMVIPHPSVSEEEAPLETAVPFEETAEVDVAETPATAVRAAGDIKPPKLIKKVEPVYPEEARKAQVEGTVILEATTDISGLVQNIKVLRSVPLLDKAAIDAVKQWVYEPFIIDDEPVGVVLTVTVIFKLK